MPASDALKNLRSSSYGADKPSDDKPEAEGEKSEMSRIIALTDDEKQAFAQAKPGEDLVCEVHGTLEDDGFHVMSVSAPNGGSYGTDEKDMAQQVAGRVMPGMQMPG